MLGLGSPIWHYLEFLSQLRGQGLQGSFRVICNNPTSSRKLIFGLTTTLHLNESQNKRFSFYLTKTLFPSGLLAILLCYSCVKHEGSNSLQVSGVHVWRGPLTNQKTLTHSNHVSQEVRLLFHFQNMPGKSGCSAKNIRFFCRKRLVLNKKV